MPCITCKKLYIRVSPCNHPTDKEINLTREDYILQVYNSLSENLLLEYSMIVYKGLSVGCPCMDCLVKMMCPLDGICDKYRDFLNDYDPMLTRLAEEVDKQIRIKMNGIASGKLMPTRMIRYPLIMNKDINDLQFFNDINGEIILRGQFNTDWISIRKKKTK